MPFLHGQVLKQENESLHSLQHGRLNFIQNGIGYTNHMKIIFKPMTELYDSNLSYHEYRLVDIKSPGIVESVDEIELVKIGTQLLDTSTTYELYPLDGILPSTFCSFKIINLLSCFLLSSMETDIGSTSNINGNYFFPLLLSNLYFFTNDELYLSLIHI